MGKDFESGRRNFQSKCGIAKKKSVECGIAIFLIKSSQILTVQRCSGLLGFWLFILGSILLVHASILAVVDEPAPHQTHT